MPSRRHRYRVLYVGNDYALLAALRERLAGLDCLVVRCPADGVQEARSFIRSDIPYSAFVFDEVLRGATGEKLAGFALSLDHRENTPAFIMKESDDAWTLADRISSLLSARD